MPRDAASPLPATSQWPCIERDIARAMLARGVAAGAVDRVLADLAPVYRAVERARITVEPELVFALLSVAADRARRRATIARTRP
jgi:hypothetical protein